MIEKCGKCAQGEEKMKIIVLDGYTENPGDLSWEGFEDLGELTVYDRMEDTSVAAVKAAIADAEIVITNKCPITRELLDVCPQIRYVGALSTGYNVIDVEAAKEKGIPVTNIPGYGTETVAQYTFALLLELCCHVGHHSQEVKKGRWSAGKDFCFWDYPMMELNGKTLGLIGFGRIGQAVARIAQAFGMQMLVYSRTKKPELETACCRFAELDELLAVSDVISLHCPLFPETKEMINAETIAKMKDGVLLINTARGPLVEEDALVQALQCGKIAGAALDVMGQEPVNADNPLLELDNCIITPHVAWAAKEARARLMETAVSNLKGFLTGEPVNVVNP